MAGWYSTKRWVVRSRQQLREHPLCVMCLAQGRVEAARVADHIIPHKGDKVLFWEGKLQSLCVPHHNASKKQIEQKGFSKEIGHDGWPVDPNHPANNGTTLQPYSIPHYIRPSAIPVHIVCGAPGSGKTTYIREHAQLADLVIDFDDIRQQIGKERYDSNPSTISAALKHRDVLLHSLAHRLNGEAWLAIYAPTSSERAAWCSALGSKATLLVMRTDIALCKSRIRADASRAKHVARLDQQIEQWFRQQKERTS